MLAQFFNILYSIVDRAFVGHIPGEGELALASIGLCAPVLTAIAAFTSLIGVGGASLMSISMGRKEYRDAEQAMNQSLGLLLGISLLLTAVALAAERPLLYALGCSPAMYPYASGYFRIYILGTPAVLCGHRYEPVCSGLGPGPAGNAGGGAGGAGQYGAGSGLHFFLGSGN